MAGLYRNICITSEFKFELKGCND